MKNFVLHFFYWQWIGLFYAISSINVLQGEELSSDLPEPANVIARSGTTGSVSVLQRGFDGQPNDSTRPVIVKIISPKHGEVIEDGPVTIQLGVENYTLAEGGNRLQVVLDNRRSILVYDTTQPILFTNLSLGGHFLRAFAVSANGIQLKDKTAFTTLPFYFSIQDNNNIPLPDEPILTVSSPRGTYEGVQAQSIIFDYIAHNISLSPKGYRLRYQLNGRETITSQQGPVFLPPLPDGVNRLIAEVIDMENEPVPGFFNRVEIAFTVNRNLNTNVAPNLPEKVNP